MRTSSIYIAAKYAKRFELKPLAEKIQEMGIEVTSTWIWRGEEGKDIRDAALMDVADVRRADGLVFIGEPQASENRGGGRWFEFGLAYALNKWCFAVLDTDPTRGGHDHLPIGHESVFTALPEVEIFASTNELLLALEDWKLRHG